MVLANLEQEAHEKQRVELTELYNKSKEVKLSKKIMIKKHQKCSIYATYQRTFLKQLLKETFELTKENLNIKENLCLSDKDKVLIVIQLFVQPDGETYCCC